MGKSLNLLVIIIKDNNRINPECKIKVTNADTTITPQVNINTIIGDKASHQFIWTGMIHMVLE